MSSLWSLVALVILISPVVIAFFFVEWRIVTAFLTTAIAFPFLAIAIVQLFRLFTWDQPFDWEETKIAGSIYASGSMIIYFIFILPIFWYLRRLPIATFWSLPIVVSLIVFSVILLLKNDRPLEPKHLLILVICSVLHSWMILGIYRGLDLVRVK